jgi:predicted RNase H-like HicB family nuclease
MSERISIKPEEVNYTVILEKESVGGFHAFCPALRGCHSEGETEAEALRNIREAMEVYLESLAAHNEPIPREEIAIHSIPVAGFVTANVTV